MTIDELQYYTLNFKFFYNDNDLSGKGCIREIITNDVYKLYKYTNINNTIIDIGGNHGLVSIILALQNPNAHIYIIEPYYELINIITQNITINNIQNITIINKALGDGNKVNLTIGNSCSGASSTLVSEQNKFSNKQKGLKNVITEIESITFDNLIDTYNISQIELLKIDCEGGEYYLYDSLYFKNNIVKNIVGEFHNLNYNKQYTNWNSTELTNYVKKYVDGDIFLSYLTI